jgi:hypothetical protein
LRTIARSKALLLDIAVTEIASVARLALKTGAALFVCEIGVTRSAFRDVKELSSEARQIRG